MKPGAGVPLTTGESVKHHTYVELDQPTEVVFGVGRPHMLEPGIRGFTQGETFEGLAFVIWADGTRGVVPETALVAITPTPLSIADWQVVPK